MNKKLFILIFLSILLAAPVLILAVQTPPKPSANAISNLWCVVLAILFFIWPLFVAVAILMFLAAGFLFLTAHGEPEKIGLARKSLLWGIVGVIIGILSFSTPFIIQYIIAPPLSFNSSLLNCSAPGPSPSPAPSGACCTSPPEGGARTVCNISNATTCTEDTGKTYKGNGTTCSPNPCLDGGGDNPPGGNPPPDDGNPPPGGNTTGACCVYGTTTSCSNYTEANCASFGSGQSTYHGDGSSCDNITCPAGGGGNPPPSSQTGTCCRNNGNTCTVETSNNCSASDPAGIYGGDGTNCSSNPCLQSGF